jgi:hypothetical protein
MILAPASAPAAAAASRRTDPMAMGSSSLEGCGTRVATVLGKPSAAPVTVTQTLVPPDGVAQITNWPAQLEGSVTAVLNEPVPSVAVPAEPKLTVPGPLG